MVAVSSSPDMLPRVFAALGDDTRLVLVQRLSREGALATTALSDGTDLTRQAITKHLAVLEDAGLVRGVRVGRQRLWMAERQPFDDLSAWLALHRCEWEARLQRLDDFLQTTDPGPTR